MSESMLDEEVDERYKPYELYKPLPDSYSIPTESYTKFVNRHNDYVKSQNEKRKHDVPIILSENRKTGIYSIYDATAIMLVECNEYFPVAAAARTRLLRVSPVGEVNYRPEWYYSNHSDMFEEDKKYYITDEILWYDLNAWLEKEYPAVKYRFPGPIDGVINVMTGKELKKLRERLGLTLAMAAKQLDVSIATWCRWQNADVVPANRVKYFLMLNDERIKSRDGRL